MQIPYGTSADGLLYMKYYENTELEIDDWYEVSNTYSLFLFNSNISIREDYYDVFWFSFTSKKFFHFKLLVKRIFQRMLTRLTLKKFVDTKRVLSLTH